MNVSDSKSSFLNNKMLEKSNIAVICIFGMFAGFLLSRVMLSITVFLFGINAIRDIPPRQWLRNKWWLLGVAWVACYALTWFWSVDKHNWDIRWQTKLPVLILPLAVSYMPRFSAKQLQFITISGGLLLLGGAFYSMSFLLTDPDAIYQYKFSVILPTLPKNDHVRASLAIALFVIWSIYTWPSLQSTKAKWLVGTCVGLLVVFMHVLAVKSGLLSLYLFLTGWGLYMAIAKKKLIGLIIIIAIPLAVIFGIKYIPTFRERAAYIDFTYFMFTHGDKSGNYGDINRLMSYKIAVNLIKEHPLTGVGTGDMMTAMDKGYEQLYPEVPQSAVLLPHNQFLIVALGCGIPAMLLFIAWVFMPLAKLRRDRRSFFFFMVWLVLFLQLMIEPVLEVQIGVFVYLFFLVLQKQELQLTADGRS
ncbi:MAG: O-antigen ligase protein [Flavipsychrobacter sp.]|nr:O-antigen ligase protein [Flavipsychrobacter sp.]